MKKINFVSRRNFIRQTSAGLGGGLAALSLPACAAAGVAESKGMARKVKVATVDLKGLWPDKTRESRIKRILERMENVAGFHPG